MMQAVDVKIDVQLHLIDIYCCLVHSKQLNVNVWRSHGDLNALLQGGDKSERPPSIRDVQYPVRKLHGSFQEDDSTQNT